MKILIVNTFYYPNMIGGTENSIKILSENLIKEGHEVAVCTMDAKRQNIIEEINGVKIYRNTLKVEKCNKVIKKLLDINNLFGISNIIWKIAKEKYNIPIVHTLRDYWMLYPIVSKKKISKMLFQPFMKNRTKYVDIVTAPSKYTLNKFIKASYFKNSKQQCVYNAINININETKKIIEDKRKKNDDNIRFMYVGMLTENKGLRNLMVAFSKIYQSKISLHIYGQGVLKDFIEDKIKEDSRIKYYGQLSSEDLKEEWIKNDVLIVPSIWEEPFGRVVIEGNQFGLPVIGANRAGILETINNINTGLTYQYDNVEELKKTIEHFEKRENIKKYYENIVNNIEKYSIKNQINEFVDLYKEIV